MVGVDSGALMGSCAPIYDCAPMDDGAQMDEAPMVLMAKVEKVIGVPADDVNPDDEALLDGCGACWVLIAVLRCR